MCRYLWKYSEWSHLEWYERFHRHVRSLKVHVEHHPLHRGLFFHVLQWLSRQESDDLFGPKRQDRTCNVDELHKNRITEKGDFGPSLKCILGTGNYSVEFFLRRLRSFTNQFLGDGIEMIIELCGFGWHELAIVEIAIDANTKAITLYLWKSKHLLTNN